VIYMNLASSHDNAFKTCSVATSRITILVYIPISISTYCHNISSFDLFCLSYFKICCFIGTKRMKVIIKQWNAVAAWRWDMPEDDMCGICRNPYDSTCSKCKFPGDDCPLLMGECNHSFHMVCFVLLVAFKSASQTNRVKHCIYSWLRQESSQEKCPMCRQRERLSSTN
jgi:anaphase-promoting complex subunit 11